MPKHIRIFLSSPGDMGPQRAIVREVLRELETESYFRGELTIEVVAWDDPAAPTPMSANEAPQTTVYKYNELPSQCDFTIVLLWSRLGTPVERTREDDPRQKFSSGTTAEFDDARAANKEVFVYLRTDRALLDASMDLNALLEAKRQADACRAWVNQVRAPGPDNTLPGIVEEFSETEFREFFRKRMVAVLRRRTRLAADDDLFRIFVGDAADDLRLRRIQLLGELEATPGIQVLTKELPPPLGQSDHAAAVRKSAQAADLCVHLLGMQAGVPVEWEQPGWSYPAEQTQIALGCAQSQLVLYPDELNVVSMAAGPYRSLLMSIDARTDPYERLERIKGSKQAMLKHILDKRRKLMAAKVPAAAPSKTVCINVGQFDTSSVAKLNEHLASKDIEQVVRFTLPKSGPRRVVESLTESVKGTRLFIIACQSQDDEWAFPRAQEAWKLVQENGWLVEICVYLAPRAGTATDAQVEPAAPVTVLDYCKVIDHQRGFESQTIDSLLRELGLLK